MKVYSMFFSATDTTRKVVTSIGKVLSERLNGSLESIDFTPPEARKDTREFSKEDVVVFGVPVIAGRVPNVLLKYISSINGNGALAVPVVLYGNRNYDDALIELRDLLEGDGFKTIAAAAFVGEHSFSKIIAKGRPDKDDLAIAHDFACKVAEGIQKDSLASPVKVKGNIPLIAYYQPKDKAGNSIGFLKAKPKTSSACNNCGLCADLCPMGSISYDNPSDIIGICIKCCACIKKCPTQAKYFDHPGYLYHKQELEEGLEHKRSEIEVFY